MILYNLFPLLAGRFSDWEPHLVRAADMGFDWIFVNPIQKTGVSGSLYSVADYFQLNPLLVDQAASNSRSLFFNNMILKDIFSTCTAIGTEKSL